MIRIKLLPAASTFDPRNRIRVTPDLMVEGFSNVYAIGDCCNTEEEKMAPHAETHAECVVENIARAANGLKPKKYVPSKTYRD